MRKKQFKAESKRLLDLMVNSIYTHKEIFLREIISNASDAIDKLCYLSLTDDKVGLNRGDFAITISAGKDAQVILQLVRAHADAVVADGEGIVFLRLCGS